MVDRYWRKIESLENDIENSMQISSILLKLKEYDEKLGDLSKIGNNENNISSNLSKIGNNENNISSNLGKIDTNKNDISSNLKKINNIENNMNIKIRKDIYKKTFVIPNKSTNYNSKNIADIYSISNLTIDGIIKINANYNYSYDKNNNFSHVYKFYNKGKKFEEVRLNHNIISNVVNDKFDIQGINSTKIKNLIYLVNNNKNNKSIELIDYNTEQVIYNDNIDTLKSNINKSNISSNLEIINTNTNNISSNLGKIDTNKNDISSNLGKIDTNKNNISNYLGKINTNKNNISSNLEKIDTNKNDISTNLININTNEDNIAYDLSEIGYIKNDITKSYLKNIYNISFYDKKTQIDFRNLFYEKVFDVNTNKNDFIEMIFKIDLQYEDISERNNVKTIYEIFDDENDNSLYIKAVANNNYTYFSNRVIVDENIFINFTKNIKK